MNDGYVKQSHGISTEYEVIATLQLCINELFIPIN